VSNIGNERPLLSPSMHRKTAAWLAAAILIAAVTTVLALTIGGTGAEQTVPTAVPAESGRYERAPYQREGDGSGGIAPAQPTGPERRDGELEKGTRGPATGSGR
jgi:hypothetical protein